MIIELKDKGLKLSFPDDMDEKEIERQISSQIYDQDMISSQNPSTFDKIKDTVNQNIPEFLQGDSAPTPDTPQPVVNPEQTVPVTQRATDLYKSGLESDTFKEPIANAVDSIDTEKRAMSYAPYMAVKAVKGAMGPFLSPLNFLGMDTEGTLNTAIEYWQNKVPEVGIPNAGIVFDENGDLDIQQIDDMPLSEILGGVAEGTGFLAPAATALKAGGLVSSLATSARPFYQSILKGMVGGSLLGGGEKDATLESMAMFGVFEGAGFAIGELPNLVKNVKNSNAYRTATIKERGLVIQDLEQTIKNNPDMSQYDLVKASDYYFKEAVKRSQNLESVNPFENTNAPASKTGLLKPDKPVVDNRTGGMSVETLKNVKDPNIRALTEKELKPIDQALIEDDVASIDFAFDNIVKEMQQTPEPVIETLDAVFNRNNIPQQTRPVEPIVEQPIDNRTGGMSIEDINNRQYQAVTEQLTEKVDNGIEEPYLSSDEITDMAKNIDYGKDVGREQVVEDLESKGKKYIDAYHTTDTKNIESILDQGIISGVDKYGRNDSVYFFADPDDIKIGSKHLIGDTKKGIGVVHFRIPIGDIQKYSMAWDGLFNSQMETYSGFGIERDIPAKYIKDIKTIRFEDNKILTQDSLNPEIQDISEPITPTESNKQTKAEKNDAIDKFFGTPNIEATKKKIAELKQGKLEYKDDPEFLKQIDEKIVELEGQIKPKKLSGKALLDSKMAEKKAKAIIKVGTEIPTEKYGIYKTNVNGKEMFSVRENMESDKGFGDSLYDSKAEAEKYIQFEKKKNKSNEESKLKQDAENKITEAKEQTKKAEREDIDGFDEGMNRLKRGQVIKALNKKISASGKIISRKALVRKLIEEGKPTSTSEVDKIKPMSRRQDFGANQQEQDAHARKIKEAGKKTVYSVGGYDLGKTAYDYAEHLKAKATNKESLTVEKEPWEINRDELTTKTVGATQSQIEEYSPKDSIKRVIDGRKKAWVTTSISGVDFPTKYKTRKEAESKAYDHKKKLNDKLTSESERHKEEVKQAIDQGKIKSHPDYPELSKAKIEPVKAKDVKPVEIEKPVETEKPKVESKEILKNTKAIDNNGDPLVVYHGGEKGITIFNTKGSAFNWLGDNGVYFTPDENIANKHKKDSGEVYSAYLNVTNPLMIDKQPTYKEASDLMDSAGIGGMQQGSADYSSWESLYDFISQYRDRTWVTEYLSSKYGYDSAYSSNDRKGNGGEVWVAFDSNQIKLIGKTKKPYEKVYTIDRKLTGKTLKRQKSTILEAIDDAIKNAPTVNPDAEITFGGGVKKMDIKVDGESTKFYIEKFKDSVTKDTWWGFYESKGSFYVKPKKKFTYLKEIKNYAESFLKGETTGEGMIIFKNKNGKTPYETRIENNRYKLRNYRDKVKKSRGVNFAMIEPRQTSFLS